MTQESAPRQFFGLGAGRGGGVWGTDDILAVAQYSPQIALAKALRVPFAPFLLPIQNTFADQTTSISNDQTFQSNANVGSTNLSFPTIVDGIMYEIDSPNLATGNALQYVQQYFYGLNSGITCKMYVDGAPKYAVSPFFMPLRHVCAMINEAWPSGWVLQPNQTVVMQFQQTITVPATPTTITVGFRMWQPIDTAGLFVQMSSTDAFNRLRGVFQQLGDQNALNQLNLIQSAPVNR